jgi:hypothetical protein
MVKILGYILQYLDEESLIPYGPGKRLYTDFEEVLNDTHELIHKWYELNTPLNDGPIEYQKVTKAMVDAQHSALVFRSREVFIWIEIVHA